jgi:ferritin-like protein
MTKRLFKIEITAEIPDDDHDIDAEAKVATKAPAHAIVEMLEKMGMTNCRQHRRTIRQKAEKAPAPVETPTT